TFIAANGKLKTRDGDLILMTHARGGLVLAANKVKSKGGKYYLNKKILDAVGSDFVSAGGLMRVAITEDQARKVIDLLVSGEAMGQPTFFLADNLLNKAREIVAPSKTEDISTASPGGSGRGGSLASIARQGLSGEARSMTRAHVESSPEFK